MSDEADFLDKVRVVFDESVRQVDAAAVAGLREARIGALTAAGSRVPVWRSRWALPAGAVAVVGAIVVASFIWFGFGSQPHPSVPFVAQSNEDMAIELSGDNLDMYADMDFYRWLQVQQQDAAPAAPVSGGNSNG